MKTHRDGFPWFSARRGRRRDAAHRKADATTSARIIIGESLGKPPFRSRPLTPGGRQEALPMRLASLAAPDLTRE